MKIKAAWREVQFAGGSHWLWLAGCGNHDRMGKDLGKVIDALRRDFTWQTTTCRPNSEYA